MWLAKKNDNIFFSLTVPSMGFIVFGIVSVFYSIYISENFFLLYRKAPSIWSGEFINGPMFEVYLSMGIGFITMIFSKKSLIIKFYYLLIAFLSGTAAFSLQGRGSIYLAFIALILSLMCIYIKINFRNKIILLFKIIILFIIIFILIIYINDFASIKDLEIVNNYFSKGINSPRYKLWRKGFIGMFKFPLGGAKTDLSPENYVHNFWLDIGWYAGVLPVIIISLFQVSHTKSFFKIFSNQNNNKCIFVLGFSIMIFGKLFLEPVMFGSVKFFLFSIFFLGYIKEYSKK
jgi:hypothetical protein